MAFIINPGSGAVPIAGEGWTNTAAEAEREAKRWLERIHAEGMTDVVIEDQVGDLGDGRWRFYFRHTVTGKVVPLDTPGIDDWDAFMKERVFGARIYWNGSSGSNPELEHWAVDGFEPVRTFRPALKEAA